MPDSFMLNCKGPSLTAKIAETAVHAQLLHKNGHATEQVVKVGRAEYWLSI